MLVETHIFVLEWQNGKLKTLCIWYVIFHIISSLTSYVITCRVNFSTL